MWTGFEYLNLCSGQSTVLYHTKDRGRLVLIQFQWYKSSMLDDLELTHCNIPLPSGRGSES